MKADATILVCGGRGYTDKVHLFEVLDCLYPRPRKVIHGNAEGADTLAKKWGKSRSAVKLVIPFPANWKMHGRGAGPIRNKQMLDGGKPDLVIAFPGGVGTADCVKQALARGIQVIGVERG